MFPTKPVACMYYISTLLAISCQSVNVTSLQGCLNRIQENYFLSTDLIIFLNLLNTNYEVRQSISRPIIYQNDFKRKLISFQLRKADAYVVTVSEEIAQEAFQTLTRTSEWNPRAKFVIILMEGNATNVFRILLKYFVFNVILLSMTKSGEEPSWNVVTYFPFNYALPENERAMEVLMDVCVEGELLENANLFPKKLPEDWRNFTVRLGVMEYPPYVIFLSETERTGFEYRLFHEIQRILGFNVIYVNKTYKHWGNKLQNGSYTHIYGDLQNYSVDVGIGLFYANFSEKWDFDLSFTYIQDSSKFIVPVAKLQEHWKRVTKIFRWIIWTTFIVSLLIVPLIMSALSGAAEVQPYKNLSSCYLICFQLMFNQGVSRSPRTVPVRLIITVWLILNCVLTNAFQSRLISALNFDHYERQVATVDEMIESKFIFQYPENAIYLFTDKTSKKDSYILNHRMLCTTSSSCINPVAFDGNYATFKAQRYLQYTTALHYLTSEGKPLLYIPKELVFSLLISMACVRGFPMLERLDQLLIDLKSNGIIRSFSNTAEYHTRKAFLSAKKLRLSSDSLSVNEIQGAFILLGLGLIVSFAVFAIECFAKHTIKKKQPRRKVLR